MFAQSNNGNSEIANVVNGGYCIGCGVCTFVTPSISVNLNRYGEYVADLKDASEADLTHASKVCPFSNSTDNESRLAEALYKGSCASYDDRIGYFSSLYAGYAGDCRMSGSSGGIVTWLLGQLLSTGLVDKVIRVGPVSEPGFYFGYDIVDTPEAVKSGSTSFYYPVTLQQVLAYVKANPGRYAITGVPCFHKALRLLEKEEPIIRERLIFNIGIVCGQMKSSHYLEYLTRRANVNGELISACFRRKDPERRADQYLFEATYKDKSSGQVKISTVPNSAIGANWGMGLFKPKACDCCDDVYAETSDTAVMDGWLPQYVKDGKGTSLVIVRNAQIDGLLSALVGDPASLLESISLDAVVESQRGGINHRRIGLRYRLHLASRHEGWHPLKRLNPANTQGWLFKLEQHFRISLRKLSRSAILTQKNLGDGLLYYSTVMFAPLYAYRILQKSKRALLKLGLLKTANGTDGLDVS